MILVVTYGFTFLMACINIGLLIWAGRLIRQTLRLNNLLRKIALQSFMAQHRGTFFAWSALGHYEIKVTSVQDPWRKE